MATSPASRGMFGLAGGVIAGAASAALFAEALLHAETLLIFLIYLAAIPLFMAGLGAGVLGGLVAALAGSAELFLTQSLNLMLIYVFLYAAPALVLTTLALRYRVGSDKKFYWYPEGYLLTALTVFPCLLFIAGLLIVGDQNGGLLAITNQVMTEMAQQIKTQIQPDMFSYIDILFARIARIAPALLGCGWMFVMMISMIIAQKVLKQQKLQLRSDFALPELHVPTWVVMAAAGTGVAGLFAPAPYDYIGTNLCIMLCVPFFFVGLAVFHAWAATTKAQTLILVLFYITLSVLVWSALLVAALGVLDQWLNFRQRFAAGAKQGGV